MAAIPVGISIKILALPPVVALPLSIYGSMDCGSQIA